MSKVTLNTNFQYLFSMVSFLIITRCTLHRLTVANNGTDKTLFTVKRLIPNDELNAINSYKRVLKL